MSNLSVKFDDNFIYVTPPTGFATYVKEHFNAVKVKKGYKIPKNLYSMRELLLAFKELKENNQFLDEGKALRLDRDVYLKSKTLEDMPGDQRLRPYQRVDVQFLSQLPAAGIFNEQRTGKTPTSILLMKQLGTGFHMIICPASLIWNWEKEFQTWFPEAMVHVVNGTLKKRKEIYNIYTAGKGHHVLVVSKDTFKRDYGKVEEFPDWEYDSVFVDEAHFLRNYKSAQSKAIYQIKAKRRYALTGTPGVKHAIDAYGILHFLYPDQFKSYWQFAERYFEIGEDFMGHKEIGQLKKHRQAEFQELIALMSVQRKRKDVMKWLPDKQYQTIPVRMTEKQQKLYERMKDEFMAYIEDDETVVDTPNILSQLMRLQQICIDPRLLQFDVESAKTQALLEWIENNDEPVVIMSKFTSYLKLLKEDIQKLGKSVGEINGQLSNRVKNENADGFQSGKFDVLLCNIQSAGVGFTLDRAESVVFTDSEWNPAINQQAEDRITPVSEDHNHAVTIIKIQTADTVDSRIENVLEFKQAITDYVNNGGSDVVKRLLG